MAALFAAAILWRCGSGEPPRPVENAGARESVTFILGSDAAGSSFYSEAARFFSTDPVERSSRLVRGCRTLAEVREYLAKEPPANGLPWGVVNLVSHGNELTGLAVPLEAGLGRTTPEILEALDDPGRHFPALASLDALTDIRLEACGLGRSPEYVAQLAAWFGGEAKVSASPYYLVFTPQADSTGRTRARRRFADTWYAFHPRGANAADSVMVAQLRKRYPEEKHDWAAALSRSAVAPDSTPFSRRFDLAFRWSFEFAPEAKLPDLTNLSRTMTWLGRQAEIRKTLTRRGLGADALTWRVSAPVLRPDGLRVIEVEGASTVVAVLRVREG